MLRRILIAAAFAASSMASTAHAKALLVPIPAVAGADVTFAQTINNHNVVAGDYFTSSDENLHGFVGTPDGQYTTFDALSGATFVDGLDDAGDITGLSNVMTDDCPVQGCGFRRTPNGKIKPLTKGGVPIDGSPGQILGQKFVGYYATLDQQFNTAFFGYYGKGTKYRADITLPFSTDWTMPHGFNASGTVVGTFKDEDKGDFPAFILKNGTATAIRYPNAKAFHTSFEGINSNGTIVGWWGDVSDTFQKAFLFNADSGEFKSIGLKGATFVSGNGINDAGIAAVTADGSSYLYCPQRKHCPVTGGAIEIDDTPVHAARENLRTRVCKSGCAGPWYTGQATSRKSADRAPVKR